MESGIYTITNIIDGKIYVGSSAKSIKLRISSHKNDLRKNKHKNPYLQNSWNFYGENNFVFEVLEYYPSNLVISMEQYWINMLNVTNRKYGYNIATVAGSTLGVKYSDTQKENVKKGIQKVGGNKGMFNPRFGCTISNEQKSKTKEKWKQTGFIKPFYIINKDLEIVGEFETTISASQYLNCDPSLIGSVLRHKTKTAKGHTACYINELDDKLKEINNDSFYFSKLKGKARKSGKNLRKIQVIFTESGNVMEFNSIKDGSRFLNLSASFISSILNNRKKSKYYIINYL